MTAFTKKLSAAMVAALVALVLPLATVASAQPAPPPPPGDAPDGGPSAPPDSTQPSEPTEEPTEPTAPADEPDGGDPSTPSDTPDAGGEGDDQYATSVERIKGATRFETAVALSQALFDPGVDTVFVATGENFPDALSGGPAASWLGGPVLLVAKDSIPGATAQELARLEPARIAVLGGRAAVSDAVVAELGRFAPTERLSGSNRFATAAAVSAATFEPGTPMVFIATGGDFPDALVGASPAGYVGGPMLLTERDTLPAETAQELARLAPETIVVIGNSGSVSAQVEAQLAAHAQDVWRVEGSDPYETSVAVSELYESADVVFVATGRNFPDALAAGPLAGLTGAPLLLVPGTSVPARVQDEMARLNPAQIVILGGPNAVSEDVEAQLRARFEQ